MRRASKTAVDAGDKKTTPAKTTRRPSRKPSAPSGGGGATPPPKPLSNTIVHSAGGPGAASGSTQPQPQPQSQPQQTPSASSRRRSSVVTIGGQATAGGASAPPISASETCQRRLSERVPLHAVSKGGAAPPATPDSAGKSGALPAVPVVPDRATSPAAETTAAPNNSAVSPSAAPAASAAGDQAHPQAMQPMNPFAGMTPQQVMLLEQQMAMQQHYQFMLALQQQQQAAVAHRQMLYQQYLQASQQREAQQHQWQTQQQQMFAAQQRRASLGQKEQEQLKEHPAAKQEGAAATTDASAAAAADGPAKAATEEEGEAPKKRLRSRKLSLVVLPTTYPPASALHPPRVGRNGSFSAIGPNPYGAMLEYGRRGSMRGNIVAPNPSNSFFARSVQPSPQPHATAALTQREEAAAATNAATTAKDPKQTEKPAADKPDEAAAAEGKPDDASNYNYDQVSLFQNEDNDDDDGAAAAPAKDEPFTFDPLIDRPTHVLTLAVVQAATANSPRPYNPPTCGNTELEVFGVARTFDEVTLCIADTPSSAATAPFTSVGHSALIADMQRHALLGHRSLLLLAAPRHSTHATDLELPRSLFAGTLRGLAARTATSPDAFGALELSAALLRSGTGVADLQRHTDLAAARAAADGGASGCGASASHPTLGGWLDGVSVARVADAAALDAALAPVGRWLDEPDDARAANADEVVALMAIVRVGSVAAKTADKGDAKEASNTLYLSSITVIITRRGAESVATLLDDPQALPQAPLRTLVRRLLKGAFTVAATVLDGADANQDNRAAVACQDLRAVSSTPLLSGNVVRYLDVARAEIERLRAKAHEVKDAGDREMLERVLQVQEGALGSIADLLAEPVSTPVRFTVDKAPEDDVSAASPSKANNSTSTSKNGDRSAAAGGGKGWVSLFEDRQIHVVAVVHPESGYSRERRAGAQDIITRNSAKKSDAGDGCPAGGTDGGADRFEVDESVASADMPESRSASFSAYISDATRLFAQGVSNAFVISVDGESANLFASPAFYVLRHAVSEVLGLGHRDQRLYMSVSVVSDKYDVADLLSTASADWRPLSLAVSPLFGTIVGNSEMRRIDSEDDVTPLLFSVATPLADLWEPDSLLYISLINVFTDETASPRDVLVTSFNISIFGSHVEHLRKLPERPARDPLSLLHRAALSSNAATVLLASLQESPECAAEVGIAAERVALASRTKEPLRPGSVSSFCDFTRRALQRLAEDSNSKGGAVTPEQRQQRERMHKVLEDHEALLASPQSVFPKHYSTDYERPPDAALRPPPLRPSTLHVVNRDNASVSVLGPTLTWLPTQQRFGSDDDVIVVSAGEDADDVMARLEATRALRRLTRSAREGINTAMIGFFDPDSDFRTQPLWAAMLNLVKDVCFTEDWGPGSRVAVRVAEVQEDRVLDHLDESYDPAEDTTGDGCIKPFVLEASPLWGPAILSATARTASSLKECKAALAEGLREASWVNSEFQREAVIVVSVAMSRVCPAKQKDDKNGGGEGGGEVGGAASPDKGLPPDGDLIQFSTTVFGVRSAESLGMLRKVLFGGGDGADARKQPESPQGARDDEPCSALFRFAFEGPCQLLCLANLARSDDRFAYETLSFMDRVRSLKSLSAVPGSTRQFITFLSAQLKQAAADGGDGAEGDKRQSRAARVLKDMERAMRDPQQHSLVSYPLRDSAASAAAANAGSTRAATGSPLKGKSSPAAAPRRDMLTAVVVSKDRGGGTGAVVAHAEQRRVSVSGGRTFGAGSVTVRADGAAALRVPQVEKALDAFLTGKNAAVLLSADARGGLCDGVVERLLTSLAPLVEEGAPEPPIPTEGNPSNSSLYVSLVGVRAEGAGDGDSAAADHKAPCSYLARDLQRADATYAEPAVAQSPLYGASLNGAKFTHIKKLSDLLSLTRAARSAATEDGAAAVVIILLNKRIVSSTDVVVNTLFVSCADGRLGGAADPVRLYTHLLDAAAAATPTAKGGSAPERCPRLTGAPLLYQTSLRGPAVSVFATGLAAETTAEEAASLLELSERAGKLRVYVPAVSSARAVLAAAQSRPATTPSSGSPRKGKGQPAATPLTQLPPFDWSRVATDTQKLLNNPAATHPKAYVLK